MNFNSLAGRAVIAAVAGTIAVGVGMTGSADAGTGVPRAAASTGAPVALDLSPASSSARLTVAVTKPSRPRSPTAKPGNARVKLTWLAPSSTGGAKINKYTVQRSRTGTSKWKTIGYPKRTSFAVDGLANGVRYYFRIRAHNAAGWSTPSRVVSAVPRTVPAAPRSPTAKPGNTSIKLAWLAPSSTGGATIDRYVVRRALSSAGPWTSIAYPTTRGHTATGLANGARYYFRIRAHNAAGWGPASTVVIAVPRTVPTAPPTPTLKAGDGEIDVAWLAPWSTGGSPINKYSLQQATTAGGPWTSIGTPSACCWKVPGLTNGARYYFRVAAHNAAGWGRYSSTANTVPVGAPSPPYAVQMQVGDGYVALSWQSPWNNGGSPIDHYTVEEATSDSGPFTQVGSTATNDFYVNGLTNGTRYYFRVWAHNAAGWSTPSAGVSAVPYTAPDAPAACSAVLNGNTMSIDWDPPSNNGGAAVWDYPIEVWQWDGGHPVALIAKVDTGTPVTHWTVNVNPADTYRARIWAYNAAGRSQDFCQTNFV